METQEILKVGIGTEESVALTPAMVDVLDVVVEEVGDKKSKKLVCTCKHPDKEEPIKITSVKYEVKGKLEVTGLWVNLDSAGLIRKGSALAQLLTYCSVKAIEGLKGCKLMTQQDDKGYLCFKAY